MLPIGCQPLPPLTLHVYIYTASQRLSIALRVKAARLSDTLESYRNTTQHHFDSFTELTEK